MAVLLRLHWGFSVRTPYGSAMQASYPLPPPPTLVGALAAACRDSTGGREVVQVQGYRVSAAYVVARDVRWASAGWLDRRAQATALIRYFTGPYQSRKTLEEVAERLNPAELFAPVNMGVVVAPGARLLVTYWGESVDRYADCAWNIHRLGSKESIVSVEDVQWVQASEVPGGLASSVYLPAVGGAPSGASSFTVHVAVRGGRPSWLCTYAHDAVADCEETAAAFVAPAISTVPIVLEGVGGWRAEVSLGGLAHRVAAPPQQWHYE